MPGWLLRAAGDLFSAQNRVDSVINDEVFGLHLDRIVCNREFFI